MKNQDLSFDDLPKAVSLINEKLDSLQQMLAHSIEPPQSTNHNQLLSVPEAAALLRLTVPTIYSKVSRGELPAMKQGNRLYFSLSELIEYLKSGRKRSIAELTAEAEAYILNGGKV